MIYHAAIPADWQAAVGAGTYTTSTRGRSLDEEGFIHASYENQVEGVANTFFGDLDELVLLVVDRHGLDGLDVPVIDESPSGDPADEHFPHIYGPLPIAAVIDARPWRRRPGHPWRLCARPESRPDR